MAAAGAGAAMSEWWRNVERRAESGEVAPSGRKPELTIVHDDEEEDPKSAFAAELAATRKRLFEVESRLSRGNPTNAYGKAAMRAAEWSAMRSRLIAEKNRCIFELQRLKQERHEAHMKKDERKALSRCASLLLACRTLLVGFELEPEEREVVSAATAFLKRGGYLT